MKWRHRLVNFRYIFGTFFISDFNLFFELFPLLFFSQFDSVLLPAAWCRVPCGAPRVQAGGAKYNFADAPDVDNFLDFVIYRCFYKYMYICVYIRRFYFLYGGWQTPYFREKHVSIMRHTREKQNLFSPFHVVVGDGVAVVAMSALFYYLSSRLVFYNFFSTGTWIKLRRVMQTVVRYFPDEASQVRARPLLVVISHTI